MLYLLRGAQRSRPVHSLPNVLEYSIFLCCEFLIFCEFLYRLLSLPLVSSQGVSTTSKLYVNVYCSPLQRVYIRLPASSDWNTDSSIHFPSALTTTGQGLKRETLRKQKDVLSLWPSLADIQMSRAPCF